MAYHVTQRGTNRQKVFYLDTDRSTYLGLLRKNLADCEVGVLAWCLMPNHVHLVVVPEREDSLSVLFRRANGRYSQYLNARLGRSGHLWHNRFFSCPLSNRHCWKAVAYVERNPVRAGLVDRAEKYRWSSAAVHLTREKEEKDLPLRWDYWKDQGGTQGWADVLLSREEAVELSLLRRCTYAGRPFGEEEFVKGIESKLDRKWRRWGFEQRGLAARAAG